MTARDLFLRMMRERRKFPRGTPDHTWRTNAARKYAQMMRGVPANQWRTA